MLGLFEDYLSWSISSKISICGLTSCYQHLCILMSPACIGGDQILPLSLAALSMCRSFAADFCAYLHVSIWADAMQHLTRVCSSTFCCWLVAHTLHQLRCSFWLSSSLPAKKSSWKDRDWMERKLAHDLQMKPLTKLSNSCCMLLWFKMTQQQLSQGQADQQSLPATSSTWTLQKSLNLIQSCLMSQES